MKFTKIACGILFCGLGQMPVWAQVSDSLIDSAAVSPLMSNQAEAEHMAQVLSDSSLSVAEVAPLAAKEMRLGFVNFRRIMATNPQLASLRESLAREFRQQQTALELVQAELADLEQKMTAEKDDVETLTQALIAKRREVARQQAAFQDDYNVRRNEELAKLQALVLEEIIALAKEQGFDVILNDNGVLYVSEAADLTQMVIERLLKRGNMPSAAANAPSGR